MKQTLLYLRLLILWLMILTCSPSQAQNVVRGIITDENNQPIPGVNVLLKGTTTELLIHISFYHHDHTINQGNVKITTTTGSLTLSKDLISKQALFPETVNNEELMLSSFQFSKP